MYRAHEIDALSALELYGLARQLAALAVTTGLLQTLIKEELAGVIASRAQPYQESRHSYHDHNSDHRWRHFNACKFWLTLTSLLS
jgi:hypothetical protein